MIELRRRDFPSVIGFPLLWAGAAAAAALMIATQPLGVVVVMLAGAAFALLTLITPVAALAILLILAPLRTLIATESPIQLPLDVGQLLFAALVSTWLLYHIAHRRTLPRFPWSPVYIPVGIFFAAAGVSAFSALSMGAWLNEWLKWAQILILIALCLTLRAQREWLVFALVLAGVANAVIGIYQFFGGSGALHLLILGDRFRAFGTFGQPNPFGGFMGLIAPLALASIVGYGLRLWQRGRHGIFRSPLGNSTNLFTLGVLLFYGVAAALVITALFMSWSRGAWLAFAVSLLVMVLALPAKLWHGLLLVGVVGMVAGVLWVSGRLPASIVERVNSATQETFSFTDVRGVNITAENWALVERFAHWQAALNMATVHPWLGVGFGNYEVAYPQHSLMNWELALGHAHNYYLNVFAETGIIGLLAYAALWVGVFALTWQAREQPDPFARLIAVGLLGTWAYLLSHSLTDNLYVNNIFIHLGVMLGILAGLLVRNR